MALGAAAHAEDVAIPVFVARVAGVFEGEVFLQRVIVARQIVQVCDHHRDYLMDKPELVKRKSVRRSPSRLPKAFAPSGRNVYRTGWQKRSKLRQERNVDISPRW